MIRLLLDTPALLAWSLIALGIEGVVVLLVFAVVRRLLRHASAEVRYSVAAGTLLLLVVSFPVTLILVANAALPRLAGTIPLPSIPAALTQANGRVTGGLPWFALVWLTGFLAAAARLLIGALHLRRVCRAAVPAPREWLPSTEVLRRAGVRMAPQVLASSDVAGPFVTGWGRGILVLPSGLFNQLAPDERDAVLMHELMHLKRGDFTGNLLQRIVTALLWFEPAVWFVGSDIERIREECCDDAVVRAVGAPIVLARALVRLEELRLHSASLALAGTGGALGARVRRLISGLPASSHTTVLHWPALAVLGAVSFTGTAITSNWAASIVSGSLPVVTIRAEDPAGKFSLEMAGGILRGMSVDGTVIPRSRLRQSGSTVQLLDGRGQSALDITISNPAGIRWTPRPATSP